MGSKSRHGLAAASQRGQGAIVLLLLVGLGVVALVYGLATPAREAITRDQQTAAALAEAKAALIGFAVGNRLDLVGPTPRVGDLPCPDLVNDGTSGSSCSNGGGTTLGRLPWKSMGLPDLRDGNGERLWYAVTDNFKNNPAIGTLNSDSRGGITVFDRSGNRIHDGSNPDPFTPSGVIAVIIAPGPVLQRQGAAAAQDRGCTGDSNVPQCLATDVCSSTATARCNPVNYLDTVAPPVLTVVGAAGSAEDNANFADGNSANGFINGDIFDASGNPVVNDRLITITYADLMPLMERRVAKEVLNCLNAYAAVPQNGGRYPWAAPISTTTPPYNDQTDYRFGRIPDGPFSATLLGLGGSVTAAICSVTPGLCMFSSWPASCSITVGTWWNNWREVVFYGVAEAYQPADSLLGVPPATGCGNCLTVDPPSGTDNKRVVVIMAGKRLQGVAGGQPRTGASKGIPANYLEDQNGDVGPPYMSQDFYARKPTTPAFNDVLLYQQ
jgi:hypothetical protein